MHLRSFLVSAALLSTGLVAHASSIVTGSFNVTVSEGLTNGGSFDTTGGNPFSGANTASATFKYTGPLNFVSNGAQNSGATAGTGDLNSTFGFSTSNISNYAGSGSVSYTYQQTAPQTVANYATLASFLASSGSAGNFGYGSYYTIDLGVLAANTVLNIAHDDGISLYQGNTRIGASSSAATSVTTDTITIGTAGDTVLRYARENGSPSVLQVNAVTPEPSSLVLLGTGLLGVCGALRRRVAA